MDKKDVLNEMYQTTKYNLELSPIFIVLRFIILLTIQNIAVYSKESWTILFLILSGIPGWLYEQCGVIMLETKMHGMWLGPSLFVIPGIFIKTILLQNSLSGSINIWLGLSIAYICIILVSYCYLKIFKITEEIQMVPVLLLILYIIISGIIAFISHSFFLYACCLLVLIFILFIYTYPDYFAWRKHDRLFYITPLLTRIDYISESFYAYVGRSMKMVMYGKTTSKEESFRKLTCDERKGVVKNELKKLCSRLIPGRIYITETHIGIIHFMEKYTDGKIRTILLLKAPCASKTTTAFQRIYGDKWRDNSCNGCVFHPHGSDCKVTYPLLLEDKFARDTYLWIFILKK